MMARRSGKLAWFVIIALAVALVAAASAMIAGTFYARSLVGEDAPDDIWRKISWRVKMFAQKATGGVPEFSWNELIK